MKFNLRSAGLMFALVLTGITVNAKFAYMGEEVPVPRLIRNVEEYTHANPKDAQGIYTLGRLHSLAFAQGEEKIRVLTKDRETDKPLPLPGWLPYGPSPIPQPDDKLKARLTEAIGHLKQSLVLYRKAVEMAPNDALYRLSYGWMLEQGMPFAKQVNAPWLEKPGKASAALWREKAIENYLKAFDRSQKKDAEKQSIFEGVDFVVSWEAGKYLLRLLKETPDDKQIKSRQAEITAHVAKIDKLPHAVTPIVFPLGREHSLTSLVASDRQVTFDLDGTGLHSRWPWVTAQTGILVWDPNGKGKITSGRQLFGSTTWQILWRNGYEPLAALDNDCNGWLEGRELNGLACWQDKNGNGRSEPGEVVSLKKLGVVRLAVRSSGKQGKTLFHPTGIQMKDGTSRPTYDWTPTSL